MRRNSRAAAIAVAVLAVSALLSACKKEDCRIPIGGTPVAEQK